MSLKLLSGPLTLGKGSGLQIKGGSTAIADTFTRANSATALGSTTTGSKPWTAQTGTWGITSNTGYLAVATNAGSAPFNAATVTASSADATIACDLLIVNGNVGITFRLQDASNYLFVRPVSGSGMEIWKVVAGVATRLTQAGTTTYTAGDTITVVTSANSITAKKNGVTQATASDASFNTATKHGLWHIGTAAGTTSHDNFQIS